MQITFHQTKDPKTIAQLNKYVQDWHNQQHPDIFKPYDFENILPWYEKILANENVHTIIACDGKKAIGYVLLMHKIHKSNPFIHKDLNILLIDQMAVNTDYQNKGIGSLLMEEVTVFAKTKKVDKIRLSVWEDNKKAEKFYKKMGFSYFMKRMEKNA